MQVGQHNIVLDALAIDEGDLHDVPSCTESLSGFALPSMSPPLPI